MMETPQSPGGLTPEQSINPNISPVPQSPQGPQVPEEIMRAELESKMADIKSREGALQSSKIVNENLTRENKIQLIKQLFAKMTEAGIDPKNPDEIKQFLDALRNKNPDLYTLFENAMNELLPDQVEQPMDQTGVAQETPPPEITGIQPTQSESVAEGPSLMDKYKSLPENVMRGQ